MTIGKVTAVLYGAAVAALTVTLGVALQAQTQAPAGGPAQAIADGQGNFTKVGCETCHGPAGRGTAAGPRIAGTTRAVADFIAYVRKPVGTMPPHPANLVSDQQLTNIHAYLRAQGGTAAAAPAAGAAAPAGNAQQGGGLYVKYGCFQCHVNEGQGGPQGPRLGPDPIPFARFSSYVRSPTGDMPPYSTVVISNQELADIYAFLASRAKPQPLSAIPLLQP